MEKSCGVQRRDPSGKEVREHPLKNDRGSHPGRIRGVSKAMEHRVSRKVTTRGKEEGVTSGFGWGERRQGCFHKTMPPDEIEPRPFLVSLCYRTASILPWGENHL